MVKFLLVLVLIQMSILAYGIKVVNDNIISFGRRRDKDSTDMILLLRGIRAGVWDKIDVEN